jgi:putative membrane protein
VPEKTAINHIDDERVRDHLANERTYLAWLRSGVATMGFGVVIAKFNMALSTPGSVEVGDAVKASHLGMAFALAGVATIVMSLIMFLENRKQIRNRNYQSRIGLVLTLAATTTALGVMVLWHLTHTLAIKTH